MREFLLLTVAALAAGSPLLAQDEAPPPPKPGVQITFLPPPMEGTLSLGIFNKAGKLVRTLKSESTADKDYVVGLNGLITQWDGKDDAGRPAAPGTYSIRGFCVGLVEVSGEAFHGNDWISNDDSPHIREITEINSLRAERLSFTATLADGTTALMACGLDGQAQPVKGEQVAREVTLGSKAKLLAGLTGGKVEVRNGGFFLAEKTPQTPAELHQVVDLSAGKGGTLWLIDRSPERVEVQQYSEKGEFLRRLSIGAGEPVPEQIAASDSTDLIYLLERGEALQRTRALALESLRAPLPVADPEAASGAPKSSTWRIVLSKSIRPCDQFEAAANLLGRAARPKPEGKIPVKLLSNPLFQDAAANVEVVVTTAPGGSFLATSDGLALRRLTDTSALKWAVLIKETKGHALLQSDGAVVEEYRIGKMTNMMAFDAGEYELK